MYKNKDIFRYSNNYSIKNKLYNIRKIKYLKKKYTLIIKKKSYFAIKMKYKIVFNGYYQMNIQWKYFYILGNIKWEIIILNHKNHIGLIKITISNQYKI